MRGQKLISAGLSALLLCPPLAAREPLYDQPDEISSQAKNECEYWAAVSEISIEEHAEYVENCIAEEMASYQPSPLSLDLSESFNASTVWE